MSTKHFCDVPWRVGNRVGRTIYAIIDDAETDNDPLIGVMDSRQLASAACEAHNEMLARRKEET